jgi:hypothetical protein
MIERSARESRAYPRPTVATAGSVRDPRLACLGRRSADGDPPAEPGSEMALPGGYDLRDNPCAAVVARRH